MKSLPRAFAGFRDRGQPDSNGQLKERRPFTPAQLISLHARARPYKVQEPL